jgi:hypothetical protein
MITSTQPYLIQQILDDMGMKNNTKVKDKAAPSSLILRRDLNSEPFDEDLDYKSVIGKLNFLEKSTRPELPTPFINAQGSRATRRSHTPTL